MNISVLVPRSVLYPTIAFDIVDGLRVGYQFEGASAPQFDIQNIGIAAKEQEIYTRCEQALMNGAEIVVAYINPHMVECVHPLFEANDKYLLVLDSGMHYPSDKHFSHAFFISLQGIICCEETARLATKSGFTNHSFTCSFYDAGYRAPIAYSKVIESENGTINFNHITALKRGDFTLEPLKTHIEQNPENSILAAFCGDMAEDFYVQGAKLNLFKNYSVFGSSYMIEEVWLDKIPFPGGKTIACTTWARALNNEENDRFKATLTKQGKANVFSVISCEAGILLAKATTGNQSISEIWSDISFKSPRGTVRMNKRTHYLEAPIYICETVETKNGMSGVTVIKEIENLDLAFRKFEEETAEFAQLTSNSWFNAYPCLES